MPQFALEQLLPDLPDPPDDGACKHLMVKFIRDISLDATNNQPVSLIKLNGKVVIFFYPRSGTPSLPTSERWEQILGARGCTPQTCSFRDHYTELTHFAVKLFWLSIQSTTNQKEAKARLHLPFELLTYKALHFAKQLQLPCFSVDGKTLIKRIT